MIRDYVRDYGGGLMMIGGEESFGLGGYYRTPIEEALPVTMEVKQKVEIPSLAVVLSIDRSGSMAMSTDEKVTKLDLAKEAAHLVVDLLDERNEVGVMSWDTEFIWDVAHPPGQGQGAPSTTRSPTIKAGGGTDGYPALKESYAVLFDRPAPAQARDLPLGRADDARRLRRACCAGWPRTRSPCRPWPSARTPIVQLMVDVAKWGRGRFYYTEDSQTIPRIFTLETQLASEGVARRAAVQAAAHRARHEAMQEIDWKDVPPLGGYVATVAQAHGGPGADEPPGGPGPRHLALRRSGARPRSPRTPRPSGACSGCAGETSTSSGPS